MIVATADVNVALNSLKSKTHEGLTVAEKNFVQETYRHMKKDVTFGNLNWDSIPEAMMEDSLHMDGVNTALLLELHRLAIHTVKNQKFPSYKNAYASPIFREKALIFARGFLETLAKNGPAEQGAGEPVEKSARKIMDTLISD